MPDLPERKVGIVACSGEEIAEGTVTRLAALEVLHERRRGETVTICLQLFLAGGAADRAFAKLHPTITVDGCEQRCAAHGTEKHSAKPAASIVVRELAAEHGIEGIDGRRCLNDAGRRAVELTAERLAALVDQVLGKEPRLEADVGVKEHAGSLEPSVVTCSCGSGVPVKVLEIGGRAVEVVALPLIFETLRERGGAHDESATSELMRMVKVYNYVPPEAEAAWRDVIVAQYLAHCKPGESR